MLRNTCHTSQKLHNSHRGIHALGQATLHHSTWDTMSTTATVQSRVSSLSTWTQPRLCAQSSSMQAQGGCGRWEERSWGVPELQAEQRVPTGRQMDIHGPEPPQGREQSRGP